MGNSSVANSHTVAHQTMSDNTTVGDTMSNDTTVGDAMSNNTTVGDAMTDNTTVSDAMADTNNSSGEGSSAIIGDFGNVSVNVVGVIVDMLDPSVRKVDGVVSLPGSGAIVRLLSVETGSRVVVSHGILVGVGGDLVGVDWHSVGHSMAHYSMSIAHSMADAYSDAKANTMANPSKQLRASRGSSHKGGDRNESLKDEI